MGLVGTFQFIAKFMIAGGLFMWVILAIWLFALAICIEKFVKLSFKFDVDGPSFMNEIQRYVLSNDIQSAIRICSGTEAMLPKVLKSGLKRAHLNETQIQNAIDATAFEVIPKIESKTGHLSLCANISTLIGLLGTIQGLIMAFGAISAAEPTQKAQVLAEGIAVAMNTTFLGLVAAISIMIVQAFLVSKADKIIGDIDEFSVKLIDLLTTRNVSKE